MAARFVIRLDDICPTMDWAKFSAIRSVFDRLDIRPLLGIVPDNQDPDLQIDPVRSGFWDIMRELRDKGWGIAQHGYQHRIHTTQRGLLGITPRSEFAGVPKAQQADHLTKGRMLLEREGLATDIFMPPFHSYDRNTLAALRETGFSTVTDGYGLFPYRAHGLVFVPQLFESAMNFGAGIYTMCLHPNNMSGAQMDGLAASLETKKDRIISFDQARAKAQPALTNLPFGLALRGLLTAKRRLS